MSKIKGDVFGREGGRKKHDEGQTKLMLLNIISLGCRGYFEEFRIFARLFPLGSDRSILLSAPFAQSWLGTFFLAAES
ncbi:hypothetical protein FAY22_04080 [Noviherbaspirillum sp. UKPF54]|nr:hypothetical protein FAY22_04080 [Noviherbaspirillum sp. UKPF54]